MSERIVISGMGSCSPLGMDAEFCSRLYAAEHFLSMKNVNQKTYPVGSLAESVQDELKKFVFENSFLKKADRAVQLAVFASAKALEHAGLKKNSKGSAVFIGSSRGATQTWENSFKEYLTSGEVPLLTSPLTTQGNISSAVSNYLELNDAVNDMSVTCSTALHAIFNAIAWIRSGMCEFAIAGGTEAPLTDFTFAQLDKLGIYTKEHSDKYPCRPLQQAENLKDTFILGEGAAVFVIEKESSCKSRGCKPLLYIDGFGFAHEKIPSATGITTEGEALQRAMRMACSENKCTPDLILMHAPGTVKGDQAEINAIQSVFENNIPFMFSGKWKCGHTYAASAALNIVSAFHYLQQNKFPEFPYPIRIEQKPSGEIKKVMINAAGFGGNAASVVVSA
ncbi:MAG: beta-ketoacyl synthase N-terminal-like domain-containing protein [Bacteroidota bacterium]